MRFFDLQSLNVLIGPNASGKSNFIETLDRMPSSPASGLLQRIDAEMVKARCRHCRRLFDELGRMIDAA